MASYTLVRTEEGDWRLNISGVVKSARDCTDTELFRARKSGERLTDSGEKSEGNQMQHWAMVEQWERNTKLRAKMKG